MSPAPRQSSYVRLAVRIAIALTMAFSVAAPVTAKEKRELTVMTRNIYLGADLTPVLSAPNAPAFLLAAANVFARVHATDFPTRAAEIAAEIDENGVDIVGLQEVSLWTSSGPGAPPSLDFLAILLEKLEERGLSFSVAATANNANVGPVPLLWCSSSVLGACLLGYLDRDVILVNDDTPDLAFTNIQSGRYVAQQAIAGPVGSISFDRGWVSIDGTLDGKKFRFATTHLETEAYPAIQETQAREFLAGPANAHGVVIAVGDFNSAADGSTTASYEILTKPLKDAWAKQKKDPGYSCCQAADLDNATSALSSRVDLILTDGHAKAHDVSLAGNAPFQPVAPRWASDHAGVVATVEVH